MQRKLFRTVLVNPPDPRSFGYRDENAPPPLGLGYIGAVLRQEGFSVDLFDFGGQRDLDASLLSSLGFFDYQLYGFTSYTKNFPSAVDLLMMLRSQNRTAVVVFGGPHASPCADELLREYSAIDLIIRNDGERPMLDLVKSLSYGSPALHDIPNLTFRKKGIMGRFLGEETSCTEPIISTPSSADLPELDALPFPLRDFRFEPQRTHLEWRRKKTPVEVAYVCSSRGCPKKCTFCSIIVMSPRYRLRSVASLMDEIQGLYAKKTFGHISFLDANFFVHPRRTLEFAKTLYAWNPEMTWSGTATADAICKHADVLSEIGRLNCSFLEVGIESGNAQVLSRFNKWTTVDQNHNALRLLQQANIDVGLDFIMFDPETTVSDLRENFAFLSDAELLGYSPPECLYNAMRLYPGTPAREQYVKMFGLRPHHLMRLIPPFCDASVEIIFRIASQYLNRYQRPINRLLSKLETLFRHRISLPAHSGRSESQEIASVAIQLSHEPYRFFDCLLSLAERSLLLDDADLDDLKGSLELEKADTLVQLAQRIIANQRVDQTSDNQEVPSQMNIVGIRSIVDIDLKSSFNKNSNLLTLDLQGTVYLIPPLAAPHRLNHTASDIWRLFVKGHTLEETIQKYSHLYGCSDSEASTDIGPFLIEMLQSDFLLLHGLAR